MNRGKSQLMKAPLVLAIATVIGVPAALAQDDTPPPTLYTTVDESEIYIIERDGTQTDVKTGESAVVTGDGVEFIAARPEFLNWPCGTSFAGGRGSLPSFSMADLPEGDRIGEVADRYFTNQQVLDTRPRWLHGESHGAFPTSEIDQFVSDAYWYKPGPTKAKMEALRPDTLLIGLFYGTGQVVVDNNRYAALKEVYGDDPIPVVFEYQEENVVPISYFGESATPAQIMKAYNESGIRPADVPMWYGGDQHTSADPTALADAMGAPTAGEMNADRLAELQQDIEANGFAFKPITLAMVPGGENFIADEGQRLRAAAEAGMESVPVLFSIYDTDIVASQCGVPPAVAAAGVLGTEEGQAPGASPPDDTSTPGDPGNSGDPGQGPNPPSTPPRPIPPEIELPNPPVIEPPASDN